MDDTSWKVKSLNSSVVLNIWIAIHNLSRQCNCSPFMWLPKTSMQGNYIWSIHASLLCWKRQCKSWFYCKIRDYRNVIVSGWEGESFSICALPRFFFVGFFYLTVAQPTMPGWVFLAGLPQNLWIHSFLVLQKLLIGTELSLICLLLQENLVWSQNI